MKIVNMIQRNKNVYIIQREKKSTQIRKVNITQREKINTKNNVNTIQREKINTNKKYKY